jgi:hypothetical protein
MKKLKMIAYLLAVADVCIEASEARARLLESQGMGPSRRLDDREVNTAEQGDQKDHRKIILRSEGKETLPTLRQRRKVVQNSSHRWT